MKLDQTIEDLYEIEKKLQKSQGIVLFNCKLGEDTVWSTEIEGQLSRILVKPDMTIRFLNTEELKLVTKRYMSKENELVRGGLVELFIKDIGNKQVN
ncbi:hypothetical protein COF68_05510 [Bacillus toyonensis]|uniref:hypothetical protein n=1 Tax=Bacillus toyonensis TaxID=155322 RepID=UPI000BFB2F20|nr:hypothetical protein [Bacillus toyonensis]PHE64300.1 hypothetical protein COF68_05510 [Bacillus toyonensis]